MGLRIWVLGAVRYEIDGRPIAETAWSRVAARQLALALALADDGQLHRDQICDALWPDRDAEAARNNLNRTLFFARRALEPNLGRGDTPRFFQSNGDVIQLGPPDQVWVDARAFQVAAKSALNQQSSAALQAALADYRGEVAANEPFADWLTRPRDQFRALAVQLAESLAATIKPADSAEALGAWERVLSLDPSHEAAHVAIMRLFGARGQVDQVMRQYQRLARALRRDVGAAPAESTRQLLRELVSHPRQPAPTPPTPAATEAARSPTRLAGLPLDSLVGRDGEIVGLLTLLKSERLITLTGPAGVGKTRLAMHVTWAAQEQFPDGAYFIPLVTISDSRLAWGAIVAALGLRETTGVSPARTLRDWLANRRALLTLDNVEQIVDIGATLAALARDCPGLRLLVTSQVTLRVAGECEVVAAPLAAPPLGQAIPHDPATLLSYPAVALFRDRVLTSRPNVRLSDTDLVIIGEICARLDGIPLALELAAARARVLPLGAIRDRLDRPLDLLAHGRRDAPARHLTLRDAIGWSYGLLSPPEQELFRALSVFVGGCSLTAALAVCDGHEDHTLDHLTTLAEHHLIHLDNLDTDEPRVQMLYTIREFAAEQLAAGDPATKIQLQQRHADYYTALAQIESLHMYSDRYVAGLARFEQEFENLRASFTWQFDHDQTELAAQLAYSLRTFFYGRGRHAEGRRWLKRLQERIGRLPRALQGQLLGEEGDMAYGLGDYAGAESAWSQALAYRDAFDDEQYARILGSLGLATMILGQFGQALTAMTESYQLYRQMGRKSSYAIMAKNLGLLALNQLDLTTAFRWLTESQRDAIVLGHPRMLASTLLSLGDCQREAGDVAVANATLVEAQAKAEEANDPRLVAYALVARGQVAFVERRLAPEVVCYRAVAPRLVALGDRGLAVRAIEAIAACLATNCDRPMPAIVAQLMGWADAARQMAQIAVMPIEAAPRDTTINAARRGLAATQFDELTASGSRLDLTGAVRLADAALAELAAGATDAIPTLGSQCESRSLSRSGRQRNEV